MSKLKKLFTPTNGAGLTHIGRLHGLQELYAYDTRMPTPCDGLTDLAGLKGLRVLILGDNLCSDTGLATLSGLSGLTQLGIGGERVTDAGLIHVAKLKGLQELTVYKSRVTGAGLAVLLGLAKPDVLGSPGLGGGGRQRGRAAQKTDRPTNPRARRHDRERRRDDGDPPGPADGQGGSLSRSRCCGKSMSLKRT